MLPTLALIRAGRTVDYVVGFQELGGADDFPTPVLEARLLVRDSCRSTGVLGVFKGFSRVPKGLSGCRRVYQGWPRCFKGLRSDQTAHHSIDHVL